MNKKIIAVVLATIYLATASLAVAQSAARVYRIGYLASGSPQASPSDEAFRQKLRELGYVEGRNIAIEYRSSGGNPDRLPDLAAELVRLKVDVLVTYTAAGVDAAMRATTTIPIVVASAANLFATNLARPGGNITGLTNLSTELSGKRLGILKEAFPKISRVAVLSRTSSQGAPASLSNMQDAAKLLKVKLQSFKVGDVDQLDSAFSAMKQQHAEGVMVLPDSMFSAQQKRLISLVIKSRLPSMFHTREWVEAGGLMAYSTNDPEMFRRAAVYVDKILKGAKPGDLPVEQPMKFYFIVNLKTAKQIGVTIEPNVLVRADKVIR
jgi:putative ABC transport system substrate-binding protein